MTDRTSTSDRDELWRFYKITATDLTYLKTQQWSVTNYALLLFAGIVGVADMLRPDLITEDRYVLAGVTVVVAVVAEIVLAKVQASMQVQQSRLHRLRSGFSEQLHAAWLAEDKDEELFHGIHLLRIAVLAGAILVCWLVTWRL